MPRKRRATPDSSDAVWRGVMIAAAIATALVFFAASNTPLHRDPSATTDISRAAVNAAEERAIWAVPRSTTAHDTTVTMTGCLQQHGSGFRLNDPSGASLPQSRNWKSGFLKKGAAPIDLAGYGGSTARDVGTRVRVTGVLESRELHVRTLSRLASSC